MKEVQISVTIPGATSSELRSVKSSLVKQGMKVEAVLDAIGVITGKVAESRVATLDAGPDATVEKDESVQLPPPEDDLQ